MNNSKCYRVLLVLFGAFLLSGCGRLKNISYSVPEQSTVTFQTVTEAETTESDVSETTELTSAVSQTEASAVSETAASKNETAETSQVSASPENANDNTQAGNTDLNYERIYHDQVELYIRTKPVSLVMYQVYDVNFDKVPELIVSAGESHVSTCEIYTYQNGEIIDLGECGTFGYVEFNTDTGVLSYESGYQGYLDYIYFKATNSGFEDVIKFYSDEGAVGDEAATYKINGEEVTSEEYHARFAEYREGNIILLGREQGTAH